VPATLSEPTVVFLPSVCLFVRTKARKLLITNSCSLTSVTADPASG